MNSNLNGDQFFHGSVAAGLGENLKTNAERGVTSRWGPVSEDDRIYTAMSEDDAWQWAKSSYNATRQYGDAGDPDEVQTVYEVEPVGEVEIDANFPIAYGRTGAGGVKKFDRGFRTMPGARVVRELPAPVGRQLRAFPLDGKRWAEPFDDPDEPETARMRGLYDAEEQARRSRTSEMLATADYRAKHPRLPGMPL